MMVFFHFFKMMEKFKIQFKKKVLKIVDLKNYGFLTEPRYYFYGWSNFESCYARLSVVKKLLLAKKYLPKGYNFKIWDGFRTRKTQALSRISFKKRLKNLYPNWNAKKIFEALNIFTGLPIYKIKDIRLTGHFSGGALDLTIVNRKEEEIDMGTDFDDVSEQAPLNYYRKKGSLDCREKIVRRNRRLLADAMGKADFKPYLAEWWHWSYNR